MHKSNIKNKNWVGLFLILVLSIAIIGSNNDVYAARKKKCPGISSASANVNTAYDEEEGDIKSIKVSLGSGTYSIWLVPDKALDSDYVNKSYDEQVEAVDRAISASGSMKIATGQTEKYKIKRAQIDKFYNKNKAKDASFYVVVLFENDAKVVEEEDCDVWSWAATFDINIVEDSDEEIGPVELTTNNKAVCTDAIAFENTVTDSRMKTLIRKGLTPCFDSSRKYNFSTSTLKSVLNTLKTFWNNDFVPYLKAESEGKILDKLPDLPATLPGYSWKEVKNTTLNNDVYTSLGSKSNKMLTCSTKNEKTYQYLYYIEEKMKNVDLKLGDGSTTTADKKVNVCKTTCREELVTTYGPPKAVIAGQCFTYEVEIQSTVRCIASDINFADFPDINDYVPCEYKAVCRKANGNVIGKFFDQAGPEEDFDECVRTCDNGKYTQSCINSCYNNIYTKSNDAKKNSKKKVSSSLAFTKDSSINRLSGIDAYRHDALLISKMSNKDSCPSSSADPTTVYNYVNNNVTGKYEVSGKTVKWIPASDCHWDQYAAYYFKTPQYAAKTVCNDVSHQQEWYEGSTTCGQKSTSSNWRACRSNASCYPGYLVGTYSAVNGFKQNSGCNETCNWQVDSVKSASGGACYYGSQEKGEEDYKLNIKKYTDALGDCLKTATVECKTDSSTYVMSVNKDTKGEISTQICDGDNYNSNGECVTFEESNASVTGKKSYFDNKDLHANSILKYNAGTCTGKSDPNMYHTILTFPGAWINNKNGEVVYKKPAEEKWYTGHPGNYCTPLTGKNVNAHWWTWYQYNKAGKITQSFEDWAVNKELVYNIFSKVQNFGHYNWNFDLGCFYAINDYSDVPDICIGEGCNGTVPDPGKCTTGKCEPDVPTGSGGKKSTTDTSSDNYVSKSITTKNMFPQTKTSSFATQKVNPSRLSYTGEESSKVERMADSAVSRTEGFNWSVNATNLSIAGYPVTPSSLVKKIESTNPYSDSELDYDITLTKRQIASIKSASKNNKFSYTSFDEGEYKPINNSYKSKYLNVKNTDNTNKYSESNIPDFSYYKSNYLRSVVTVNKAPTGNGLKCNNLSSSTSCDLLTSYTSVDEELITFINNTK